MEQVLIEQLQGGEHHLPAGYFELEGPLQPTKPLRVVGAGPSTVLKVKGARAAISSTALVELINLSLICEESAPMAVLELSGPFRLEGLYIQGQPNTTGVLLCHMSSGSITACTISHCAAGIMVKGQAHCRLENSTLQNNQVGVSLEDCSSGELKHNVLQYNQEGIAVYGNAILQASHNLCQENVTGIAFGEEGQGLVQYNLCQSNYTGIEVGGGASVELLHNLCQYNQESGIILLGESRSNLQHNRCQHNQAGIMVETKEGQARLEQNACNYNQQYGIALMSEAWVENNALEKQGYAGIMVFDQSPTLKQNHLGHNPVGIATTPQAAARLIANVFQNNQVDSASNTRDYLPVG